MTEQTAFILVISFFASLITSFIAYFASSYLTEKEGEKMYKRVWEEDKKRSGK